MRKYIWLIIAVILIIIFAVTLLDHNPPILMLSIRDNQYSAKLWTVILFLIILLIILYIIFSLIKMVVRIPKRVRNSIVLRRDTRQLEDFIYGLESYLIKDSDNLFNKLFAAFNNDDNQWRLLSGLLLLSDASRPFSKLGLKDDKNLKILIRELNELDLDIRKKYIVKYLSIKAMSSQSKILRAAVLASGVLDELEVGGGVPGKLVSYYLLFLLEYGKIACKSGNNESLICFLEKIYSQLWLKKLIMKKISYEDFNNSNIIEIKKHISECLYLICKNHKNNYDTVNKYIKEGFSYSLINDKAFIEYINYLVANKKNDFASQKIKEYLDKSFKYDTGNYINKVFSLFVKARWISKEDKLCFAEPYFLKKKVKLSFSSLYLMGDICLENNLSGKAKDYYEKSLNTKETMEALICIAKYYVSENQEKTALSYYQKAFDMLLSK